MKKILIGLAAACITVLFALGVLFLAAAVIGWRTAQRVANEVATIQNLKTIAAVEIQYFNTHDRSYGTIDQLLREQMLSSKFSGRPPVADGYVFTLALEKEKRRYTLAADPRDSSSGNNHFYLDSDSDQIHQNRSGPAGPQDPAL